MTSTTRPSSASSSAVTPLWPVRHCDEVTRPACLDGVSALKFLNQRHRVVIAGAQARNIVDALAELSEPSEPPFVGLYRRSPQLG